MKKILFLFLLVSPSFCSNLVLNLFNFSRFPNTKCNDGTPGGFYFRNGTQTDRWVIFLEGGDWCFNEDSCQQRYIDAPQLMSSSSWPKIKTSDDDGILNQNCDVNPFWCEANHVYAAYCSSDGWSGSRNASSASYGWNFMGANIVDSMLEWLISDFNLDSLSHEIVLTGCSAGGRGATFNINRVTTKYLPNVVGLLDSNWWLDINPLYSSILPFRNQCQMAAQLYNPQFPEACFEEFGNNSWKCFFVDNLYPYITTPNMIQAYQYDQFQLDYDTNNANFLTNCQAQSYALSFQQTILSTFSDISGGNGIYSPSCYHHCSVEQQYFYESIKVNNKTLSQAFLEWFQADHSPFSPSYWYLDSCTEFNCGEGCPEYQGGRHY